jgi:hypothetical protein
MSFLPDRAIPNGEKHSEGSRLGFDVMPGRSLVDDGAWNVFEELPCGMAVYKFHKGGAGRDVGDGWMGGPGEFFGERSRYVEIRVSSVQGGRMSRDGPGPVAPVVMTKRGR